MNKNNIVTVFARLIKTNYQINSGRLKRQPTIHFIKKCIMLWTPTLWFRNKLGPVLIGFSQSSPRMSLPFLSLASRQQNVLLGAFQSGKNEELEITVASFQTNAHELYPHTL